MASEEMTSKLFKPDDVIKGSYIELTQRALHIDIFDIATNIDVYSCGFASIDETREKLA